MNVKKPIIAFLVSSIGIAALSLSFSFAWFNTAENLYVDTLVISIAGQQNILISTSDIINFIIVTDIITVVK